MRICALFQTAIGLALSSMVCSATEWPSGSNLSPTARPLPRGELLALAYSEVYFKHVEYTQPSGRLFGVTYWDIQGTVGLRYAVTDRLELGLRQVMYQDNHKVSPGFSLPDDLFLSATLAGFGPAGGHLRCGAHLTARIPLAKYHNVVLEPYSAGRIELLGRALFSLKTAPGSQEGGLAVDWTLGILNHNDMGKRLTNGRLDSIAARLPSRQVVWAMIITVRRAPFVFSLAASGNRFLQHPPPTAYSRENYLYLSPSVSYRISWRLTIGSTFDLRLHETPDQTAYSEAIPRVGRGFNNYPPWRLRVSAQWALRTTRPRPLHRQPSAPVPEQTPVAERELVRQLAQQKLAAEEAERQLERIREERERVARILAKLREMIAAQKAPPPAQGQKEKP